MKVIYIGHTPRYGINLGGKAYEFENGKPVEVDDKFASELVAREDFEAAAPAPAKKATE